MLKGVQIRFDLSLKFLAAALIILATLLIVTSFLSWLFNELHTLEYLIISAFYLFVAFLILWKLPVKPDKRIRVRDSFMIIILIWVVVPLFGMLPFLFASPISSVTDALLESYSGFTTTGFTTLTEFPEISASMMFWRAAIQWLGGMGIIIFVFTIFPLLIDGNLKNFFSDLHDTELSLIKQRLSVTARSLLIVYIFYTFIGILALYFMGLGWFDSVLFSLASISSGGGVLFNGNISHLSIEIKTVIAALMLVAGSNYFLLIVALRRRKNELKTEEIKTYLWIILTAFVVIALVSIYKFGYSFTLIFESIFNVISLVSTTGFYSINEFVSAIPFVWILMFFLLFIGSSTGSSGGGINIYRIIILAKMLIQYIKNAFHPNAIFAINLDQKPVQKKETDTIIGFFVVYLIVFFLGTLLFSLLNFDFKHAMSLCASVLSNTGPGVFLLNEYFPLSEIPVASKYLIIILMLIGRVEIFPFLIIISKSFWKK